MNELSLFIEYLLLSNEFVTVPGIGTLVAQPYESVYDAEDETLLPPYRQVSFNPEEQEPCYSIIDDIRKVYALSQKDAERKLCVWTMEFFQTITDYGCVDFGSVGSFTINDGVMTFHPSQSGVTTPEYYALDVLHVQQINKAKATYNPIIKSDEKDITIRISKKVIAYAAAACIALLLVFASGAKFFNTDSAITFQKHISALFLPSELIPSPDDNVATDETPSTSSTQAEATTPQPTVPETTKNEPGGRFCIVLASAISQQNAEEYVKTLRGKGFDSARILEGKMIRVAIGNYQTEREAYTAVRELHQAGGDFQYAWVYENKTR